MHVSRQKFAKGKTKTDEKVFMANGNALSSLLMQYYIL